MNALSITDKINFFLIPILVILGFILNLLTIIVFCRRKMRKYVFSVSMIALAISDTLVLVVPVLFTWIDDNFFVSFYVNNTAWCSLHGYTDLIFSANSSWIMILISIERWFAVCRPWEKSQKFTKKRLYVTLSVQFMVSTLLFAYFPLSLRVTKIKSLPGSLNTNATTSANLNECSIYFYKIYSLMGTFSVLIVYVIPFFLLIFLNAMIIVHLRSRPFQNRLEAGYNKVGKNENLQSSLNDTSNSKTSQNVNVTLVTVACCNLILTFPFQAFWFYEQFIVSQISEAEFNPSNLKRNLGNLTFILKNMNYLINFFLYSALSRLFKEELFVLLTEDCFKSVIYFFRVLFRARKEIDSSPTNRNELDYINLK